MDVISIVVAALILFATKSVEQISSEVGGATGRRLGSLFGTLRGKLSRDDDRTMAAAIRSLESGRAEPTKVAHLVSVLRRLARSDREIKNILQDIGKELNGLPEILQIQHATLVDQIRSIVGDGNPSAGTAIRADNGDMDGNGHPIQQKHGVIQVSRDDIPSRLISLASQLPIDHVGNIHGQALELLNHAQQYNAALCSERIAVAISDVMNAVKMIDQTVADLKKVHEITIAAAHRMKQ